MARTTRNTPKTPAATVTEPPQDQNELQKTYIRDLGSIFTLTGAKTYDDQKLKDALRKIVNTRNGAIEAFIEAKLSEGLTLEEINAFSSVQMPLMPTISDNKGRRRVEWPFEIIGPDD